MFVVYTTTRCHRNIQEILEALCHRQPLSFPLYYFDVHLRMLQLYLQVLPEDQSVWIDRTREWRRKYDNLKEKVTLNSSAFDFQKICSTFIVTSRCINSRPSSRPRLSETEPPSFVVKTS